MRKPRTRLFALAAAAGALLALTVSSPASAAYHGTETDYATASSAPGDYHHVCTSIEEGKICYQPYGDKWYVYDKAADGNSVAANWNDDGSGRSGACVNKLGAGRWGVCNKNYTEGNDLYFRVGVYNNGNWVDEQWSSTWSPA